MKLLFLRGQVPTDRPKEQIMYDNLGDCCDMWTQLAFHLCKDGYGEIWYWGGRRKVKYASNFIERWVPSFKHNTLKFYPDVIFCRGGFPQYDVMMSKSPRAFKIYYGAGRRYMPQSKFKNYDLVLIDTPKQLKKIRRKMPQLNSQLFVKPAADNIFTPQPTVEKKYDVIFSSNEHKRGIKGHHFILPAMPDDISMVQSGIVSKKLKREFPNIEFTGWIPRRKIPKLYSASKVAVVCCESIDSCPRVIPEALACGCPLLLLDTVNVWAEKYINDKTGKVSGSKEFITNLRSMISNYGQYSPYEYYRDNLSLPIAADYIKNLIKESKK